jgi:hypothetical protein
MANGGFDTPYNGLLIPMCVEGAMDDGCIATVPYVADDPSTEEVSLWEGNEPKQYKWRIMYNEADILDLTIMDKSLDRATIAAQIDIRGSTIDLSAGRGQRSSEAHNSTSFGFETTANEPETGQDLARRHSNSREYLAFNYSLPTVAS